MKKVFVILAALVFGFFLYESTFAEVTDNDTLVSDTLISGRVEGTGTYFEVTDSEYLNVILNSTEPITLTLESVPEMITMHIESASEATSTQITLSGFEPSTTYYKYEDDYHNEETFTTDGNGTYTWTQDISQLHLVFIQPRKSTKFIKDNSTGGDCYLIGNWDSTTKTCILTTDVYETIQIDSNNITLDGNGHTITGTGTGSGIYLYGRTGVTIKNLNVKNFAFGIHLYYSSNNILINNTASNNVIGVYLWYYNNNNTLTGNNAFNNSYGIYLSDSSNNTLVDNITQENSGYDLWIWANHDNNCNNVIQNTTGSGGRPIKYFNSSVNLENETLSELILCNGDYSNINNITVEGSGTLKNNGLILIRTDHSDITNITSSNNASGIFFSQSSNNTFTGNAVINNNYYGICLAQSSNNNTLTSNTSSNNFYGIYLFSSSNNQFYNNNFINNRMQTYVSVSPNNIFNLEKPSGGNYWSDFDTSAEGCYDTNSDSFCDAPYYFTGGIDDLPWTKQNGWEVPADTTPPSTTITISGTLGNNDWYTSNVQVTLTAVDNEGGSGVNKIEYSFDGSTWNTYSSLFTIIAEGITTIYYKSTDNDGNVEAQKSISINIDKTVPTITTVTATPNTLWPPNHKMVDVKIDGSATDNTSGIASIEITVTDEYGIYNMTIPEFGSMVQLEAWREGTDKDGRVYTITVVATDNAGNKSTATTQVTVPHDMGK